MAPRIQGIDLVPAIRGVHEHMSTWMSSLINAQDGCLQTVAQRASMGRTQQEHLAHQVAQRSIMPSMTDQVTYLRAQLAHRDAQLEQVRAEMDNHFVQEEEVLAHMRLLSSEAKDWKSRVVTEAEEVLCRESAQISRQRAPSPAKWPCVLTVFSVFFLVFDVLCAFSLPTLNLSRNPLPNLP